MHELYNHYWMLISFAAIAERICFVYKLMNESFEHSKHSDTYLKKQFNNYTGSWKIIIHNIKISFVKATINWQKRKQASKEVNYENEKE